MVIGRLDGNWERLSVMVTSLLSIGSRRETTPDVAKVDGLEMGVFTSRFLVKSMGILYSSWPAMVASSLGDMATLGLE